MNLIFRSRPFIQKVTMNQNLQFEFPAPSLLFPDIEILLHQTLREQPIDYSILKEYPLVFTKEQGEENVSGSLVGRVKQSIVTHLNLLTRHFVDADGSVVLRLGFVTNVATHPQWQKKGYMTSTFKHLDSIAAKQNLDALLLWGDLSKFYQSLGFMSLGRERRYHLSHNSEEQYGLEQAEFRQKSPLKTEIRQIFNAELTDEQLQILNKIRPDQKSKCLRQTSEFKNLLKIPDTYLYCCFLNTTPLAYAVMGRGKDFIGVIHEWGAISFSHLQELINNIFASSHLSEILLLSPAELPQEFSIGLSKLSKNIEQQPMAMAKVFNTKIKAQLEEVFVWGLDSI